MKRFISILSMLLLLATGVVAQQFGPAQFVIHYKFIHVQDTSNRAHPFTQDMILLAGNQISVYKAPPRAHLGNASDLPIPKFGIEYYLFPAEKKIVRIEGLFNAYRLDESWPTIDWQIRSDTATKGGLHCQKATTHFRGRDYSAWFCPNLPLHAGPWKLNGLPGMIVEAYDATREVQFLFAGLEKGASTNVIQLPKDAIKTTEAELARLKVTAQKNPEAFSKALTIQAGGVPGKSGPQIDMKPMAAPVINNPIELPEKKAK